MKPKIVHVAHTARFSQLFIEKYINYLSNLGADVELWIVANEIPAHLKSSSFKIKLIPSVFCLNPILMLKCLWQLTQKIRETKVTIFHCHTFLGSILPLIAARIARVPIRIYHNHGFSFLGYRGFLRFVFLSFERLNVSNSTQVIAVSQSNLIDAVKITLVAPNKISLLGQGSAIGIDTTSSWSSLHTRKTESFFKIGYVGRPVARKGFHRMLEAWPMVLQKFETAQLIIAGYTEQEAIEAFGKALPKGVKVLGFVSDMHEFYIGIDLLTLPSDHEGFGQAILEAAALGVPCIGSNISGVRCAIQSDLTGWLLSDWRPVFLANAIVLALSDLPELQKRGFAAKARATTDFSPELILEELQTLYTKKLNEISLKLL